MTEWRIIHADVLDGLAQLPDASVQTVVTSPPYWGLRDYGTASWDGGDAACDHMQRAGQRQDTERQHVDGFNGPVKPGLAELPYRDRCGKCGAVRIDSQLGLEPTPEAYVERMVGVFREVRRVLRPDGTCWLNLGDSYAGSSGNGGMTEKQATNVGSFHDGGVRMAPGLKPKDLVGIPWRVAFALQADGWYLRSDVIWSKPNPMPESVTDRPTKAHEYVFLLTRSARYYYDADAVREPHEALRRDAWDRRHLAEANGDQTDARFGNHEAGRNLRSVWSISTEPYPEAHFATFPKALVVPCVKAGTSEKGCCAECGAAWMRVTEVERAASVAGPKSQAKRDQGLTTAFSGYADGSIAPTIRTVGWEPTCAHQMDVVEMRPKAGAEPVPCTVLDPFAGSGTTGVVALRYGRSFVGIELSAEYAEMARERIRNDGPLFNVAAEVTA